MAFPDPGENSALSNKKKYETCQESNEQLVYAAEIIRGLPRDVGQLIMAAATRQSSDAIIANFNNFRAHRAKTNREMLETQFTSPKAPSTNDPAVAMEVDSDNSEISCSM